MADTLFYEESTGRLYRIAARRLTVGDGIAVDSEQDQLSNRPDVSGRLLLTLRHYPLLVHGTARAEVAHLETPPAFTPEGEPVLPDGAVWEPVVLTERTFLELDELLSWAWIGAVLECNPHRNPSYSALKKALSRATPTTTSAASTTGSETTASSDGTG